MSAAACPLPGDLERLYLGGLPEEQVVALEHHAMECRDCLGQLKQLIGVGDALSKVLRGDARSAASESSSVVEGLMQKLEALRPSAVVTPVGRSNPLDATVAVDATPADADLSLTSFLAPPEAGDELGRLGEYRILEILGRGGMGVVFKAEDPKLKRIVAVKAMLPSLAASPSNVQRFVREAHAMAAVEHDHIVRIYQIAEDRGVPFLAMELLRGETLEDRLKRSESMSLCEVLRIGREVAAALAAAHATGLIHRDIKPANVWLESQGDRVKLLDFGLVRAAAKDSTLTQQGVIVGTPAYMAPEQGRGQAVDARCDLFSLGVVLYRLCTGQLPFQGDDSVGALLAVALNEPPSPLTLNAALPQELSEMVMQLLEKDPVRRPASADAVIRALRGLERLRGRPSDADATTIQRPARRRAAPPRRRSRFSWLVAAAALLGVLGLGWYVAPAVVHFVLNEGELAVEVNDPDVEVTVRQNEVVIQAKGGGRWVLKAGPGVVEMTDRKTGETLVAREFLLKRNGKDVVRVSARELADARAAKSSILGDPGTLSVFYQQIGKRLSFRVTGANNEAAVWGSDVYTLDSNLAKAAVHSGALRDGQTGVVEVELLASPESFDGSVRNDVKTLPYGPYAPGAFRFPKVKPGPASDVTHPPAPPLAGYPAAVGKRVLYPTRGNTIGSVWGTDVYTQDSDLGAAAVHAGFLKRGETGMVEIEFVEAPKVFTGSNSHGVASQDWRNWNGGAFRIIKATPGRVNDADLPRVQQPPPVNLMDIPRAFGSSVLLSVTGNTVNSIWGTDVYSLDSDLGAAAVHAGILRPGETKTVEVEIVVSPEKLTGSTRNGVTSSAWGEFPAGAYRFVRKAKR
jgi:hypothetical protein